MKNKYSDNLIKRDKKGLIQQLFLLVNKEIN